MFQKRIFKIIALSLSLSIISLGSAFGETFPESKVLMDTSVSMKATVVDEALYEKQAEIDKKLFEEGYAEDLGEKGISITHTGVVGDSIEVGITPYTPENGDIIKKLLGDDVKVVEGIVAVTLQYSPELYEKVDPRVVMDPAELADDSQIVTITADASEEAQNVSTTVEDAMTISAPAEEKGISPIIVGIGAVAAIGVGGVFLKKKTA